MDVWLWSSLAICVVINGACFRFQRFTLTLARGFQNAGALNLAVGKIQMLMSPAWLGGLTWLVQGLGLVLIVVVFVKEGWGIALGSAAGAFIWGALVAPIIPFPTVGWLARTVQMEALRQAKANPAAAEVWIQLCASNFATTDM